MNKNALLIIDPQFDFCDPKGSLYVDGAEDDMNRLGNFITKNSKAIEYIGVSMDSHHPNDISHPAFWKDKDGKHPDIYTSITFDDVMNGKWSPIFFPQKAIKYIEDLEKQGEFPHTIWPYHTLIGSKGASFVDSVINPIIDWSKDNSKLYQVVTKGTNILTEHFGIFRANIPIEGAPETQLNQNLIKKLEQYENVFFAGEAKSHCVANSLKQIMDFPTLAKRFVILEDCMSNVTGFEHIADSIYENAINMGIKFVKSTDISL